MTVPGGHTNRSTRFFGKRIPLVIIIILVASLTFDLLILFILLAETDKAQLAMAFKMLKQFKPKSGFRQYGLLVKSEVMP
jgi:hypothetical protein